MKRVNYSIVITFIIILFTASCSMQEATNNDFAGEIQEDNNIVVNTLSDGTHPDIEVQSPMTLSNSMCTYFYIY